MKTYRGVRSKDGKCKVTVDGRQLKSRSDLCNHSSTFEWGFAGSGPAQLALAILADYLKAGGEVDAVRLHQAYKHRIISHLPKKGWAIPEEQIAESLVSIEAMTQHETENQGKDAS